MYIFVRDSCILKSGYMIDHTCQRAQLMLCFSAAGRLPRLHICGPLPKSAQSFVNTAVCVIYVNVYVKFTFHICTDLGNCD